MAILETDNGEEPHLHLKEPLERPPP